MLIRFLDTKTKNEKQENKFYTDTHIRSNTGNNPDIRDNINKYVATTCKEDFSLSRCSIFCFLMLPLSPINQPRCTF